MGPSPIGDFLELFGGLDSNIEFGSPNPNNPCMVYFPTFTIKINQM